MKIQISRWWTGMNNAFEGKKKEYINKKKMSIQKVNPVLMIQIGIWF